tara:strand:+ start:355 stop:873 length:519 start_codon:yes stop_codon:yes gene_type:complete
MKWNKHLLLLSFSVLILSGGCISTNQQEVSDGSLKECIHFDSPMQRLCDTKSDCLESNEKAAELLSEKLDPDDKDYQYTYAYYQNLIDIDKYRCEPTELVPLLRNGQEVTCTRNLDCSPKNVFFGITDEDFPEDYPPPKNEVVFCENGICKMTKYSHEELQKITDHVLTLEE